MAIRLAFQGPMLLTVDWSAPGFRHTLFFLSSSVIFLRKYNIPRSFSLATQQVFTCHLPCLSTSRPLLISHFFARETSEVEPRAVLGAGTPKALLMHMSPPLTLPAEDTEHWMGRKLPYDYPPLGPDAHVALPPSVILRTNNKHLLSLVKFLTRKMTNMLGCAHWKGWYSTVRHPFPSPR